MQLDVLSTQRFIWRIKILGIMACLLLAVMFIFGFNLFIQIRAQGQGVDLDYWVIQHPLIQFQREVLRLQALVDDKTADSEKIKFHHALVQSRVTIIIDLLVTKRIPDPNIEQAIVKVNQSWEELQPLLKQWEADPAHTPHQEKKVDDTLHQMELGLNDINIKNQALNELTYRRAIQNNQQVILLMGGATLLWLVFVGTVVFTTYHFVRKLQYTQFALHEANSDLETRVMVRTQQLAEANHELMRLNAATEQANVKLQEASLAKSRFITLISHELRTPLNAINGFTELLLLGLSGDLPDMVKSDLQLIYNNGQHLLALINDILYISQIESGEVEINATEVAVAPVIDDLLLFNQDNHLQFIANISSEVTTVYVDPVRLKWVLLNLLNNAIKFTPQGSITVQVGLADDSHYTRFAVIDTGIGIPSDKQHVIFEKFQQADMSDARQYGGTGLGLSICRELVMLHGGQMGVKSEVGVGSEFWFTIPRY